VPETDRSQRGSSSQLQTGGVADHTRRSVSFADSVFEMEHVDHEARLADHHFDFSYFDC